MFERLTDKARDTFYLNSGIFIDGNKEIIIENCKRIEEYNEIFMQLVSGGLVIQIWGSKLRAYDFKTNGLIIKGRISRIELTERSRHEKSTEGLRED